MRIGISLDVSPADRRRLKALVRDRNTAQEHVWRAEIVLLSADGLGTVVMSSRSRPAAIMLDAIARKVPVHAPTARCAPRCGASMPGIMAATAAPGCMPRFARKAGRQAVAASRA